jgi:hypothetical protein
VRTDTILQNSRRNYQQKHTGNSVNGNITSDFYPGEQQQNYTIEVKFLLARRRNAGEGANARDPPGSAAVTS